MSVSETALIKTEKATPHEKSGGRSEASLPPRIREKQSIFPYYSVPTREFMRSFADHFPEWILRRREKRLTAEDIIEHHQLIREAYRRLAAGEKLYEHKSKPKKPVTLPIDKDPNGPFITAGMFRPPFVRRGDGDQTRLSLKQRKRLNDVAWLRPGHTKHVTGAPPMNPKEFIAH